MLGRCSVMKRILAVTSGKGGVGKSTCAVGIAVALCKSGKKVLLIDLDAGLRCLDIMTGADDRLVFDLFDVLNGKPLEDAVLKSNLTDGLFVLAAPSECCTFDGTALCNMLLSAKEYDYIILDFPAGVSFPFCEKICDITDFIVVTTADRIGMRDSFAMASALGKFGCVCRLVINKFDRRLIKKGIFGGIDDMIDCSGCRLLGVVPFDRRAAMQKQGKFYKKGKTVKAFERIAKRIYGYEVRLPKIKKIQKGK